MNPMNKRELRFAFLFLLGFFLLHYAYSASRGSLVEHLVIDIATVKPGAAFINLVSPEADAVASGHRIVSPEGTLSILNGCEGTETMFLLIAAILAFSASWKRRIAGALAGILLVYALNQCRIVALFLAVRQDRNWFDMLHGYVAPTLIIALSALYFLWWSNEAAD